MPKYPIRLPFPLSDGGSPTTPPPDPGGGPVSPPGGGVVGTTYSPQGREYDIAIAGIPFMLATIESLPQSIETIATQRNQFDAENDPGEQSLTSWWRRSQSSWHAGAGDLYQENADRSIDSRTFWDSSGVDVFTPGQLTLLKKMTPSATWPLNISRMRAIAGPTVKLASIAGGSLYVENQFLLTPTEPLIDGAVSGTNFVAISNLGTLYMGQTTGGTPTSWPLGQAATRLGWGKHRLWLIGGRKIWQPNLDATAGTAQNPIFTHPDRGWIYTCMAEGGSAMLFGGYSGDVSTIQSITLDGGSLPTLSGAADTAVLPGGEYVQELAVLAGQFVGIGTNHGFRVGTLDSDGRLTYGPLIIEGSKILRCTALITQGRFFLVAFETTDNKPIAYRVDTGTPLDGGIFPYAKDIECPTTGHIVAMASVDRLLAAATSDGAAFVQSATEYVDIGTLQTGRVRYRTTELKAFKQLTLEIEPLAGNIQVSLIKEGGSELPLGNVTEQGEVFNDKFNIDAEPMRYSSVKITMTPDEDGTATPVIHSYQLRALPSVPPQRLITLALLCYDKERARSGQFYGGQNHAAERLSALQEIEDQANTVLYQDFSVSNSGGRIVTIESIRFVQTAPGPPNKGFQGDGGIIIIQLRTVV